MTDIEQLDTREAALRRHMSRLLDLIDQYRGPEGAYALGFELSRVVGEWRASLVWRDRLVYRPAAASPELATRAAECQQRMAALAERVETFSRRWSSSALIGSDFDRFRSELQVMIVQLEQRLDRAETALRPPADVIAAEIIAADDRRAA